MFENKGPVDEITDYLKKNLKKGYTKESLRWALRNQGYSRMEVERAMQRTEKELADEAPILKSKPKIEYRIIPVETKKKKNFWDRFF